MTAVTPPETDLHHELDKRGLTQIGVARRMGVSGAQVSRLLSGEWRWSLLMARAFAIATGIPLSAILGDTRGGYKPTE